MKMPLVLRPRERRLAFVATVIIATWGAVSWGVQPLWDKTRELKDHLETQTGRLNAVGDLLEHAAAIDEEHQQIAPYLSQEDEEGSAFLHALEAISRRASVQLNLKPHPVKREERLSRFEVELDVEGAQDRLLAFLDELLRMPTLLTIERLRISSVSGKERSLRANLVVQKLTLIR